MTTSAPKTPAGPASSAFDRETAVVPAGTGRWRAMLHGHWNINANPNGGYAMTPLLRAMAATLGESDQESEKAAHADPISLTTHFLRPAVAGSAAELEVEVIRSGRRTSTVRGSMVQGGKARLETIATFADLGHQPESGPLAIEPPDMPPPDECPSRVELTEGVELPLLSRVEVRIDPRHREPGRAVTAGWIRLLDGRGPDTLAVAMMADCFPPSIFGLAGRTGWVPTIELTVHVRRRPVDGWLRGRFETRDRAGSTVIEDGVLWDATDRVVAQARQLAMVTD